MNKIFFQEIEEVRRLIQGELTVSIVGFGYVGSCIGALLASNGVKVHGIDRNQELVGEINRGTTSIEEPGLEEHVRRASESNTLQASTNFDSISISDIVIEL